jgi:2-dehydropantoate 2-reductase
MTPTAKALRPPIHILGAGSIGQLWAISIRSKLPSYPVTLMLRGSSPGEGGSSFCQKFWWRQTAWEAPREATVPIQYVNDQKDPIHTLVVTTKSYQAKDAVESILNTSNKPTRVIVLCNGALSVRDELLPILKNDVPLILATTTHGAYREENISEQTEAENSCLVHAGIGTTFIQDEAADLAVLWDDVGLSCSTLTSSAMDQLLWKKLAANCVINPLTAIFRCTNGDLLLEPSFYELQHNLLYEVAQVAQACTGNHDMLDETTLRQFVGQVIHDTKNNKSSMLQDVLHGKQTEIEHLNSYIVRKGRALGIECPENEDMVSRILEIPVKR